MPGSASIPLPKVWPRRVRSAVVHAVSMANVAFTASRAHAENHFNARIRLLADNDRLRRDVALLHEEIRIKNTRMKRVPAQRRPHDPPIERLAILELRALRGWSLTQTADRLLVKSATVSSWMQRLDETGPSALVQIPVPVNRFPEFVGYIVQRLKVLCPSLGYVKIAQALCRAGLHLGTTTIRRMLRAERSPEDRRGGRKVAGKRIVARHPNHIWGCDLSTVPISFGFWTSIVRFGLPQRWPFCWWVAIIVDHFSRRIMGSAIFRQQPTAQAVKALLARAMRKAKVRPRHLITDQGPQFIDGVFRSWCKRIGIHQRFGAIGKHGSTAVIERLILTVKNGCTRPRFEPKRKWPTRSPCAAPQTRLDGLRGAQLDLRVSYVAGRKHLPIVALERVA